MRYVNVTIVGPDQRQYDARINADADTESLIADLVRSLNLNRVAEDGVTSIRYGVNLIGGTRVTDGVTLQLYEIPLSNVDWIKERGKR